MPRAVSAVPHRGGVVGIISELLQGEPLDPLLSLLKHAGASIRQKVELLHHHIIRNAALLPDVHALWHNTTDKWRRFNKSLHLISLCNLKNGRIRVEKSVCLRSLSCAAWHRVRRFQPCINTS